MKTISKLKRHRIEMSSLSKFWVRCTALLIGCFVSMNYVSAQTLKVDGALSLGVCPSSAVTLQADGFASTVKAVDFSKSTDGGSTWTKIGTSNDPTGFNYVEDVSEACLYKAVAQGSSAETNTVEVTMATDCANLCMTTTTGDYYLGTDFNPESGCSESSIVFGDSKNTCLENHFEANHITFVGNSGGKVVKGWKTTDVDADAGVVGENYYYVFSTSTGSTTPFKLTFDRAYYKYKTFRFTMRLYLDLSKCDGFDTNAKMNFRTNFGNGSTLCVDSYIYDATTGESLASLTGICDDTHIDENIIGNTVNSLRANHKFLRMEFTFYGKFENQNVEYQIYPEFQQWNPCAEIGVDYISGEALSVCIDRGAVCIGQSTLANAAGFPRNSNYVWEYYEDSAWKQLYVEGFAMSGAKYQKISIPVTEVGKRLYRVRDSNSGESVEFPVYGKNCEPVNPSEIEGPDQLCAPFSGEKFSVSPLDANQTVKYTWKLTDPNGNVFGSDQMSYSGGNVSTDTRGGTIYLTLNKLAVEGEYTITVQPIKTVTYSDGSTHEVVTGTPIDKKFKVYKTPTPSLKLLCEGCDGQQESDKMLCPTDKKQVIEAVANIDPTTPSLSHYVYTWTNTQTVGETTQNSAYVSLPSEACEGTLKQQTIGVHVEIADVGCPADASQTYKISPLELPTINCASIGTKISKTLSATEKTQTVQLPTLPESGYTAGCESDPTIVVDLTFTPTDTKLAKITKTITTSKKSIATDMANNKVTLPAGTGTVTYTVKDGCDHSASCSLPIEILDKTAPNIDCSQIPSYTAHLQYQGGKCDATPGVYSDLPTLEAPVLTDLNGVDGAITGVYKGRVKATSEPAHSTDAQRALFSNSVDLNDPYSVGNTYILWEFSDLSGNKAYCVQRIEVIDDVIPNVVCPDFASVSDVDNQEGACGLSVNGLLAWLANNGYGVPSATDVCSREDEEIVATIYFQEGSGAMTKIEFSQYNDIIFHADITYTLTWRFYKLNGTGSYGECTMSFTVRDTEAPKFDCSQLEAVTVAANNYHPNNEPVVYLDYATKDDIKVAGNTYTGTLATAFSSGAIRMLSASDVTDNCDNNVTVTASLFGPDDKGKERTVKIKTTADLEKLKYGIGLSTLTFTFTDEKGNSSTCDQIIRVVSGTTPIPDCTNGYDTLYVDDKCLASLLIQKNEVPTAQIPVNRTGCYFNLRYPMIQGAHIDSTTIGKYFPDSLYYIHNDANQYFLNPKASVFSGGGFGMIPSTVLLDSLYSATICEISKNISAFQYNEWNYYMYYPQMQGVGTIFSASNSLTQPKNYTGYPFKVTLEDSEGNILVTALNEYDADETAPTRLVVPRWYSSTDKERHREDIALVCESEYVKLRNNFEDKVIDYKNLSKGTYKLTYYFQDKKDGTQIVKCITEIAVIDTTSPKVVCGDWNKSGVFPANASCVLPASEVSWFKKPTAEGLNATDNCTADYADFTITWKRLFESKEDISSAALTEAFQMGTTTMYWYIADQSGNKTQCVQTITVNDSTGPVFDCHKLSTITAYTNDKCVASYDDVHQKGLKIPAAAQDACSPTNDTDDYIYGVPTRDDGKAYEDDYPIGQTTITWTFTDGANNVTSCIQFVIVKDTAAPVFDCSTIQDVTYELPADECAASKSEIEAALGSHTAQDACEGDIPGVPYVKEDDDNLVALYATFASGKTYDIIWRFEDSKGNIKDCPMTLTVKDTTPPDPSGACPPPTKDVDATTDCNVNYSDLNLPSISSMKIVDDCDGDLYPEIVAKVTQYDGSIITYRGTEVESATYPVGTHTFYWIYTDNEENKDTCTMLLTVNDKIKPVIEDCDVDPHVTLTVDDNTCSIDAAEVKTYIREPKAYDECDDALAGKGTTYIKAIVERYYIDSTCVDKSDRTTCTFDTTLIADGITKQWDEDAFVKGLTLLRWIFIDKSGNPDSCEKTVTVVDHTAPYFDCDDIDPDTLRPEAPVGSCEVEFKFLKENVLDTLHYMAWDACAGDSIPGVLTLNGDMELPDSYTMEVGVTYKLLWLFEDEDGNPKTCPQYILPSHLNPLNIDCTNWPDTVHILAEEGTCEANQDSVVKHVVVPQVDDACGLGIVVAEGFADSLGVKPIDVTTTKFATGYTPIYWRFVSPWNLHDTAWCHQMIAVDGNNKFNINCDVVSPTVLDTLDDCGPTDPLTFMVDTPRVPDPCLLYTDTAYWRYGDGTRLDGLKLDEGYPLGLTQIKWTFTDFTGFVDTFCVQDVYVRTNLEIIMNCDSINNDTLHTSYVVPDGVCVVDAGDVLDPDTLVPPSAKHPCLDTVQIKVYPRRADGKSWTDQYIVGINEIEWVFIDPSHTTVKDSVVCIQNLQVGDSDAKLFKCDSIPNKRKELDEENCTIDATAINFTENVPKAYDACGSTKGEEVVPTFSRTSGKSMSDPFTVGKDSIIWNFHYISIDRDVVCYQEIHVLDSKEPIFDCDLLPDTTLASKKGECYLNSSAIKEMLDELKENYLATDACDDTKKIKGVYDESVIPSSLYVGDTITVHWIFQDTTINLAKKECDQKVTVIGDKKPIFDCSSLAHDTILIEGCDTTLDAQIIVTPYALDACTNDSVAGVGRRLDGGELYGVYPVGTTTIRWTFTSPFSTVSDSCDEQLTVLTKQELDFDCESLDSALFNVATGECSTLVTLPGNTANHPCPAESGVSSIKGIPSLNGTNLTANADSTEWSMTMSTGIWNVTWTFTDYSNTMANPVKTCTQIVKVGDVNEMPVKCENYPDTVIVLSPADCEISWAGIGFQAPEVVDLCSGNVINPTLTRWSGKSMDENFTVGLDTVYWNYSFAGQDIMCKQAINVLDSVAPFFDCSTLTPIQLRAKDGLCNVSPDEITEALGSHSAIDSCTNAEVPGRAYVEGIEVSKVTANVGDTLIVHWIFKNDTINALAKECDQVLTVIGHNAPIFDCSSLNDTTLYLRDVTECELPGSAFTLTIPVAMDTCTGVPVQGVASRQDGLSMTDNFAKGTTVIIWSFQSPYSDSVKICLQNVIVADSFAPIVDCSTVQDTLVVGISADSQSNTELTYNELLEAGFVTPSVTDVCDGEITAVGKRSDNKNIEDNYPLGFTDIVWTYSDLSGNSDTCHQVIFVEDVQDTLYCADTWNHKTLACLDTFPIYGSFAEFLAAGGSVSKHSSIDTTTFRVTETFTGKEFCDETHYRTYHLTDPKGADLTCTDTIYVKDNVSPSFNEALALDTIITCTDEIPSAVTLTAYDNCDPQPTVTYSDISTRSTDPNDCDYYNYKITYNYTAADRCNNTTDYSRIIFVKDTIGPKFDRPTDWKDTVLANNLKSCKFGVPDFVVDMGQYVKDECSDNIGISITQYPEAGSHIRETTKVWIIMSDLCNNRDSIYKVVRVQDINSIVSLSAYSIDTCASTENPFSISSQNARYADGKVEIVRSSGVISRISSQFSYDYYKGDASQISDENLIFTDNPLTHPDMVKYYRENGGVDNLRIGMTALTRHSQSGYYTYVAMDTITGCADTATAQIQVNEAPRISIASGTEPVCEFNLLDTTVFDSYINCIDPMGRPIIAEGWLNQDTIFNIKSDTIYLSDNKTSMVYYATNSCGTTTSLHSLGDACGVNLATKEDTMNYVGNSEENYQLFLADNYYKSDSILLDVHERYNPANIVITTEPHDPARIWLGEIVELALNTDYTYSTLQWYKVVGRYDRENVIQGIEQEDFYFGIDSLAAIDDEEDYLMAVDGYGQTTILVDSPQDTTKYYVTLSDGVCPSVASDLVQVNVILKLPTAFTPYEREGLNDTFMERHIITIFDRYGQKVFEGDNGWDGTKGGKLADPGVYYYTVVMTDGSIRKGSIEVVYLNE